MFVTTSGRAADATIQRALLFAHYHQLKFVPREKKAMKQLLASYQTEGFVFTDEQLEWHALDGKVFFFHPNMAQVRYKRWLQGETDAFLQATALQQGEHLLDCTAGFLSDALLASVAVGEAGKVVALEKQFEIATIIENGIQTYQGAPEGLEQAMRRIQIVHVDAIDYLNTCPDGSFDVVYLDPMFDAQIVEATNFEAMHGVAAQDALTAQWVKEAIRVAKRAVVLKAHFRSPWFEQYGFVRTIRKSSKFHYGIYQK